MNISHSKTIKNSITEARLQQEIILWWEENCSTWNAESHELFHIPNGLIASNQIRNVKALGVRPGIPDLFLAIPNDVYAGLFIELKAPSVDKTRGLSRVQTRMVARLNLRGYSAVVVNELEDAIMAITAYMEGVNHV